MLYGRSPRIAASFYCQHGTRRIAGASARRVGPMHTTIRDPKGRLILEKQVKDVYNNSARLKELMTASPMTAAQHAAINRKRIRDRRMLEDARERRSSANELF